MSVEITEKIQPLYSADWRDWLDKNHKSAKEIWVVFYKKSTGKQTFTLREAMDQALCFGWIDSIERSLDNERYALRFTPRRLRSNWSKINIERYKMMEKEGLIVEAGKKALIA